MGSGEAAAQEERRRELSRTLAIVLAAGVLLLGGGVFALWLARVPLALELPEVFVMKANTALCVATSAMSLLLSLRGGAAETAIARFLGVVILVVAGLTMLQYVSGVDLGIDQAIVTDPSDSYPGRMAPTTATGFLCIGLWLTLFSRRSRLAVVVGDSAIYGGAAVALMVITAYLYDAPSLYGTTRLTRTAPHTAIALLCLCAAGALGRGDAGLMKLAMGRGPGSLAIRWMLPFVVVVPIVLGLIRLSMQAAGLLSPSEGFSLVVVSQIVIIAGVAVAFALQLNRARAAYEREKQRREAMESFITMCAWTKQVRLGDEWVSVERYLKDEFGISITHGISQEAYDEMMTKLRELPDEGSDRRAASR